jgi:CO/xanthine dehydrogenase FAD-binding subunit
VKPARFEYFRPTELSAAIQSLNELGDEARVLAGGQSLIPMMNLRLATPEHLIDLSRISGLAGTWITDSTLRVGAMTRQQQLLQTPDLLINAPLVVLAAENIGHVQTRSRGTVGGSLANADPASELSLAMITLGARITVCGPSGPRIVDAQNFFVDAMTTSVASNEILTEVHVPLADETPVAAFQEFSRRHGDFALVSVAIQRLPKANQMRVGIGAVATTPRFCPLLSGLLADGPVKRARILQVLEQEFKGASLLSDSAASAEYRKLIAVELILQCLREVF